MEANPFFQSFRSPTVGTLLYAAGQRYGLLLIAAVVRYISCVSAAQTWCRSAGLKLKAALQMIKRQRIKSRTLCDATVLISSFSLVLLCLVSESVWIFLCFLSHFVFSPF